MYTEQQYNNSLCHHGIKGQKWGVRRYQNPDGSLTAAGRNRYGISESEYKSMSRSERKQQKKKYKLENYKSKLEKKTKGNANYYKRKQEETQSIVDDLAKKGKNSQYYKDYVREQVSDDFDSIYDDLEYKSDENNDTSLKTGLKNIAIATAVSEAKGWVSERSDSEFKEYYTDMLHSHAVNIANAKYWQTKHKKVMNYKIDLSKSKSYNKYRMNPDVIYNDWDEYQKLKKQAGLD